MNAQGRAEGYLYVYPVDGVQPGANNPALQNIFQQFQVVSYVQSFPGAMNFKLQNAHEIHCHGDLMGLMAALQNTGLFTDIELAPYYTFAGGSGDCPTCTNPQTVNDPDTKYEFHITEAGCAWNITQGDPSIVVAVVDTHFDLTNSDLDDGQIVSVTGTPGDPMCDAHGTAVAGMIVAQPNNNFGVAGLAPNVKVAGYVVETMYDPVNDVCTGEVWKSTRQQPARSVVCQP